MTQSLAPNARSALIVMVFFTVLCGAVYPVLITGAAQGLFPSRANGSLAYLDGKPVGSRLIGQNFADDRYFHPRPSAAGSGYDAAASSGSNLGPSSRVLLARVREELAKVRNENGLDATAPIPVDAVTASASGLDPHISPANAYLQAPRVARARGISEEIVKGLIERHTEGSVLGFAGEPRVNVLELNLALDRLQ